MEQTHAAISSQRSALLAAFKPSYEDGDARGNTRIHLTTERWRVCETWFSPSLAGVDSAGLGEVIQNVLARFSEPEKARLASVRPLLCILPLFHTSNLNEPEHFAYRWSLPTLRPFESSLRRAPSSPPT